MQTIVLLASFILGLLANFDDAKAQSGKVEIQWLGQSVFRITTPSGKVIVTDPWLANNPKAPPEYKTIDTLGKVDVILVSHAHYDHFEDAPALARKHNVPIYAPAGLNQALLTLGVLPATLVRGPTRAGRCVPSKTPTSRSR